MNRERYFERYSIILLFALLLALYWRVIRIQQTLPDTLVTALLEARFRSKHDATTRDTWQDWQHYPASAGSVEQQDAAADFDGAA